jgi:outer membrane immunogenic protein
VKKLQGSMLALGLLSAAVPSFAADAPSTRPLQPVVAAPLDLWTGIYLGVHAGYAWGDNHIVDANVGPTQISNLDPSGWLGGFQIGYNRQLAPNWFAGLEVDLSASDLNESGSTSPSGFAVRSKIDYFGTVRTRIGYAADRTLFYLTGGFAWSHGKFFENPGSLNHDEYHGGWTAGAGLEYAFDPRWSAKVEYLYADLGRNNEIVNAANRFRTIDLTINLVRVGLNYRFGGSVPAFDPSAKLPVKALGPAPIDLWAGGYLGVHGGYASGSLDVFNSSFITGRTVELDLDDWFGGFQSGYNWRFAPNWVFGIEADTSFANLSKSGVANPGAFPSRGEVDQFGTARVRFGPVLDRLLVYATGGLAWAHYEFNQSTGATPIMQSDRYLVGWSIGAGLEYAFDQRWSAKVEYLFSDFDGDRQIIAGANRTVDLSLQTVKFGVNYRFAAGGR